MGAKTAAAEKQQDTIWNPTFVSIFIVNFAMNMGQFMMNTLIPKYADALGATASVVGMVSSMFAVTALAIRPLAGPAFDYFSKKRLLTLAIGIITLAYLGYSTARSIPMVMASRLLHGIGIGCTAPLCLALASDSLPEDRMGSGIGFFSLCQAISSAVGPSVGLALSSAIGYPRTFLVGAVIMGSALILSTRIKEKRRSPQGKYRISLKSVVAKEAVTPAVIMAFLAMAYSCINAFVVLYGGERNVEQIGLFFTVYAVFLLLSRPLSGAVSDRFGLDKTIIPACICFAAAFYLISISRTLPMFLVAGGVSAFGYGACQPAMQALCMRCVPKDRRGAGANTNYIGVDLGNLMGPAIAGRIVEQVQRSTGDTAAGYVAMYRWMILPIGIGLLIFLLNRKKILSSAQRNG